jgi:hypothetical protein
MATIRLKKEIRQLDDHRQRNLPFLHQLGHKAELDRPDRRQLEIACSVFDSISGSCQKLSVPMKQAAKLGQDRFPPPTAPSALGRGAAYSIMAQASFNVPKTMKSGFSINKGDRCT